MPKKTLTTMMLISIALSVFAIVVPNDFGNFVGIIASMLVLVTLILGLLKQARQRRWGWFVCTLLFGYIGLALYLIVVPETPQYVARPVYYEMPQYQPPQYYQPYQEPMNQDPPQPLQEVWHPETPQSYQEATQPDYYQEQGTSYEQVQRYEERKPGQE